MRFKRKYISDIEIEKIVKSKLNEFIIVIPNYWAGDYNDSEQDNSMFTPSSGK